jgi:phosphoglucomutase
MAMNEMAGKLADTSMLVDIPRLVTAYYTERPDPAISSQRVLFGTSGHRGSSFDRSFNEWHILATSQAICDYRRAKGIDGPLFLGIDTHALSEPAFATAMEVLAANGVDVMVPEGTRYTPTPAISHAILVYNRSRQSGLADGIVVTPSHNPPEDGGFKYNPPHGGPAETAVTAWIQARANDLLKSKLRDVKRILFGEAMRSATTHRHNYIASYVKDLGNTIDMGAIRSAGLKIAADPLGGAGVHFWQPIADHYRLDLTVTNTTVDASFRFMTADWDGKIRMDPSSPYAMKGLIGLKDRFDVAFACDTDHDRHGIVTRSAGLMPPNHYLSVCIRYLFSSRPEWRQEAAVGKTVVSSSMIDRVAAKMGRSLFEVPVGFKWFVEGLLGGVLGFAGEESAGSAFLRRDGTVWTTDKDGIIAGLLAAEITAKTNRDPGEIYRELTAEFGDPVYERIDAPATTQQKAILARLSPSDIHASDLAGQKIRSILTTAPGDGNSIGGVKIIADDGWFAARPSGTEEIYKIYAESFRGRDHLEQIKQQARDMIAEALRSRPN